jgi:UDP-2,3-diacylglucosamine pyrophosphatase LpxH
MKTIENHLKMNHYVICLGDYHDRGGYSEEVMASLLRWNAMYPRLYLLVGNHEFDYIKASALTPTFMMYHLYHAGVVEMNGTRYFLSHAGMPVEKDYNLSIPREEARMDEHYRFLNKSFVVNNHTSIGDVFRTSDLPYAINMAFITPDERYFALLSILTWRDYTSEALDLPYANREHVFDTATMEELFDSMKKYNIDVVVRGHQAFTPLHKVISSDMKEVTALSVTDTLIRRYCVTIHSTDTCGSFEPNYLIINRNGFTIRIFTE